MPEEKPVRQPADGQMKGHIHVGTLHPHIKAHSRTGGSHSVHWANVQTAFWNASL